MQTVVAVTARVIVEHPDTLLPTIAREMKREMSYCKKEPEGTVEIVDAEIQDVQVC
jgi:hypothetical protein